MPGAPGDTADPADLDDVARAGAAVAVVEALVENKERLLRPGMFANVELVTGSRSLPAVPRASVRVEGGTSRAFFVAGGRVEERLLTLGPDAGDLVSVLRGASLGDLVAVGKLDELSNGRAVR